MQTPVKISFIDLTEYNSSDMNCSSDDSGSIVTKFTNTAIKQRIPCIVYIGMLSIVGIVGNLHVLLFFTTTNRKQSTYKVFVTALSMIDLMTSIVHMPLEILDLMKPYTFYNELGCKIFRFNYTLIMVSSVFILLLIALERYRRVCNPLKIQMSVYLSKRLCILAIFTSLVISFPSYLIHGHHFVNLVENGVNATGYMCFISDQYHGTTFLYSYSGFMFIVYITSATFLVIIYFSVCRVVFSRHATKRRNQISIDMRMGISATSVSGNISHDPPSFKPAKKSSMDASQQITVSDKKRLNSSTLRKTRTLIFITALFILVFPSSIILYFVNGMDKEFKEKLSDLELTCYQIGIRLVLINNVSNPLVYGFTDERFQNGIRRFYCRK